MWAWPLCAVDAFSSFIFCASTPPLFSLRVPS
jgi:hypothetical protein